MRGFSPDDDSADVSNLHTGHQEVGGGLGILVVSDVLLDDVSVLEEGLTSV